MLLPRCHSPEPPRLCFWEASPGPRAMLTESGGQARPSSNVLASQTFLLAKCCSRRWVFFFCYTGENKSPDLEERNEEGSEFSFPFFVAIFLTKYSS